MKNLRWRRFAALGLLAAVASFSLAGCQTATTRPVAVQRSHPTLDAGIEQSAAPAPAAARKPCRFG